MSGVPQRFALSFSPPVLACEYKLDDQLHTIKVEFHNLTDGTDASDVLQLANDKLKQVVTLDDVDPQQVQNLVLKLIDGVASRSTSEKPVEENEAVNVDELPADLRAAMGLDDPVSEPEPSKPKESPKKYSGLSLPDNKQKSQKDAAEDVDDLLDDLLGDDIDAPLSKSEQLESTRSSSYKSASAPAPAPAPNHESEEEEDLNKVSDFRLRMAKKQMDEQFEKNLLRPGMDGYQYDKAVEFGDPDEDMGWDSD